jgi:2-oxo-4-hydroxy-4-carboxy--5-ureidoimidazoline (OHCU) decarboxylase
MSMGYYMEHLYEHEAEFHTERAEEKKRAAQADREARRMITQLMALEEEDASILDMDSPRIAEVRAEFDELEKQLLDHCSQHGLDDLADRYLDRM